MEILRKVLPRPHGRNMLVQPHKDAFASMPKGLLSYSKDGAVFSRQKTDVCLFYMNMKYVSGTSSYLRINLYKTLPELFRIGGAGWALLGPQAGDHGSAAAHCHPKVESGCPGMTVSSCAKLQTNVVETTNRGSNAASDTISR